MSYHSTNVRANSFTSYLYKARDFQNRSWCQVESDGVMLCQLCWASDKGLSRVQSMVMIRCAKFKCQLALTSWATSKTTFPVRKGSVYVEKGTSVFSLEYKKFPKQFLRLLFYIFLLVIWIFDIWIFNRDLCTKDHGFTKQKVNLARK